MIYPWFKSAKNCFLNIFGGDILKNYFGFDSSSQILSSAKYPEILKQAPIG